MGTDLHPGQLLLQALGCGQDHLGSRQSGGEGWNCLYLSQGLLKISFRVYLFTQGMVERKIEPGYLFKILTD